MACADPEVGGRGSEPPLKNHKNIGFSNNRGPDPLKYRRYQASIECWVNIGTPVKRHLMAFHWWDDDGPLIVVPLSSLPSSTKQTTTKTFVKVGPPLTKLSGSAHDIVCVTILLLQQFSLLYIQTLQNDWKMCNSDTGP